MSCLLKSVLATVIARLFAEHGLTDIYITGKCITSAGDGFVGTVIGAEVRARKGNEPVLYHTVVKTGPNDVAARKYLSVTAMMKREMLFYEHIAPLYRRLQEQLIVNPADRLQFAQYYGSHEEHLNEALVIENLKTSGYSLADSKKPLDYDHASVAVKTLAKFHALSLILQQIEPEVSRNISEQLTDCLFESSYEYDASGVHKYAAKVFDKFVGAIQNEDYKMRLQERRANFSKDLQRLFGSGNTKVISHGDYWIKNIMFKHRNGTPTEAVIIDYQIVRHSSLMNDFLSFIGTCFESSLRRNHYHALLRDYQDALRQFLSAAGYRHEQCCSEAQLEQELDHQSFFGLGIGIFMIPFFDTEVLDIQVMYSGNLPESFFKVSPRFVELANDLVEDYVTWGYL